MLDAGRLNYFRFSILIEASFFCFLSNINIVTPRNHNGTTRRGITLANGWFPIDKNACASSITKRLVKGRNYAENAVSQNRRRKSVD